MERIWSFLVERLAANAWFSECFLVDIASSVSVLQYRDHTSWLIDNIWCYGESSVDYSFHLIIALTKG